MEEVPLAPISNDHLSLKQSVMSLNLEEPGENIASLAYPATKSQTLSGSFGEGHVKSKKGHVYPIFPAPVTSASFSKGDKDLSKIKEIWFQPCSEDLDSPKSRRAASLDEAPRMQKKVKTEAFFSPKPCALIDNDSKYSGKDSASSAFAVTDFCKYSKAVCLNQKLHGLDYCHQHILVDEESPFIRCSYVEKSNRKRCQHPVPRAEDGSQPYCLVHSKPGKEAFKPQVRRKRKKDDRSKGPGSNSFSQPVRTQALGHQSSCEEEEDFGFFTDAAQVDGVECSWLGNQDSDAESTDSEDESPLDHAGAWTLEEAVRICREKMIRLRQLYAQQFKYLNHALKQHRRKMLTEYDMDPQTLSKVGFPERTGDDFHDFIYDAHLSNYQKPSGQEALAEKALREKKLKGLTSQLRKSDLPRCTSNTDGYRCPQKVLPYTKFCLSHVCLDFDQYLYTHCAHQSSSGERPCLNPVSLCTKEARCLLHAVLLPRPANKGWENLEKTRRDRLQKSMSNISDKATTAKEKSDDVGVRSKMCIEGEDCDHPSVEKYLCLSSGSRIQPLSEVPCDVRGTGVGPDEDATDSVNVVENAVVVEPKSGMSVPDASVIRSGPPMLGCNNDICDAAKKDNFGVSFVSDQDTTPLRHEVVAKCLRRKNRASKSDSVPKVFSDAKPVLPTGDLQTMVDESTDDIIDVVNLSAGSEEASTCTESCSTDSASGMQVSRSDFPSVCPNGNGSKVL